MIKETSNQLKARARGTLLGHYGLPIGASILTTAGDHDPGRAHQSYGSKEHGRGADLLPDDADRGDLFHPSADRISVSAPQIWPVKKAGRGSHLSFSDNAGSCDPAGGKTIPFDPGLHASVFGRSHHLRTVLPASDFKDHYGAAPDS